MQLNDNGNVVYGAEDSWKLVEISSVTVCKVFNGLVKHFLTLLEFEPKQVHCTDRQRSFAEHDWVLEFWPQRSKHRFVWAELLPPGWTLQHFAALHYCGPQVVVNLQEEDKGKVFLHVFNTDCHAYYLRLLVLRCSQKWNVSMSLKFDGQQRFYDTAGFSVFVCVYLSISASNRWVEDEISGCQDIHQGYCIIL